MDALLPRPCIALAARLSTIASTGNGKAFGFRARSTTCKALSAAGLIFFSQLLLSTEAREGLSVPLCTRNRNLHRAHTGAGCGQTGMGNKRRAAEGAGHDGHSPGDPGVAVGSETSDEIERVDVRLKVVNV